MKTSKSVYVAALLLLAGGLGFLLFTGLSGESRYFLTVQEAMAMPPGQVRDARLFGTVDGESISSKSGGLGVSFRLADKDDQTKSVLIDYKGVVPDTFKPGVEVIAEGRFEHDSGVFKASSIMTKCPSKYQKENRAS